MVSLFSSIIWFIIQNSDVTEKTPKYLYFFININKYIIYNYKPYK